MGRRERGSVYQDKHGQWWAQVRLDGGKLRRARCPDRKEAQRRVAAWLAEIDNGVDLRTSQMRLHDWLEHWLTAKQQTVAPRTLEFYHRHAAYLAAHLGHIALERLEPRHIRQALASLGREGLAPRSVAHCRTVLHTALAMAVRDGALSSNPVERVDPPRVQDYAAHDLSIAEIAAIAVACEQERLGVLFLFILDHGVRHGEARALRWADVDLDAGLFVIRDAKSAAGRRTLPLTAAWVARLQAHWQAQQEERQVRGLDWQEHGHVFPSEAGTQLGEQNVTRIWKRVLRNAGLCDPCVACQQTGEQAGERCAVCHGHGAIAWTVRIHDLRHTAISSWIADGADPKTAQALAGHSSPDVTMRIYAHHRAEGLRAALERTEERRRKRQGEG